MWPFKKRIDTFLMDEAQLENLQQFIETCIGEAILRQEDRIEKRIDRAKQKTEGQPQDGGGQLQPVEAGMPARKLRL